MTGYGYLIRRYASRWLFGSQGPELCSLALSDPQAEIQVCLCGPGVAIDVTHNHTIAATQPLTIAIALNSELDPARAAGLFLRFREIKGESRLLGKIDLGWNMSTPLGGDQLHFFRSGSSRNYCNSRHLAWRHDLGLVYRQWRARRNQSQPIRLLPSELRSLFVLYVCPRPVFLVSVADGDRCNIFPMDLVGSIGSHYFSLALHRTSTGIPLIEASGRLAIASVPAAQMNLAYQLGKNHNKPGVDLASLPFALTRSAVFGLPVPKFALRVRELELETVRPLGSHTFFLCRIVEDQHWADGPQFFQAHSFYEPWRQRAVPLKRATV